MNNLLYSTCSRGAIMINLRDFLGLSYYTSPLDLFLNNLRARRVTLSRSQQQEITKYQQVYTLRDSKRTLSHEKTQSISIWDQF